MTHDQIDHLFRTYAAARRVEQWVVMWSFVGAMMSRDQRIEKLEEALNEAAALQHQNNRALEIFREGHSRLYQQAYSSPRTIDSVHVRKTLLGIDERLRGSVS